MRENEEMGNLVRHYVDNSKIYWRPLSKSRNNATKSQNAIIVYPHGSQCPECGTITGLLKKTRIS
jgi:hypothetical protein